MQRTHHPPWEAAAADGGERGAGRRRQAAGRSWQAVGGRRRAAGTVLGALSPLRGAQAPPHSPSPLGAGKCGEALYLTRP